MAQLTINLPDDFSTELTEIANQLKLPPEQCVMLALSHFLQTDTVENAIEGVARTNDGETLVDFPELKQELGLDLKFHPQAMEELESLSEEEQVEILGELIERITAKEEELHDTIDLVLKEENANQLVLSGFGFGDVIYQIGDNILIYHIALMDEFEDEEEDEDEEDETELEDEVS